MIWLEPVLDPLAPESLDIQASILNSQPEFNQMVLHKAFLEPLELEEENRNNLTMGRKCYTSEAMTGLPV